MMTAYRERSRGFEFAYSYHKLSCLAKAYRKPREVTVAGDEHKSVNIAGVQNVHRVDYHGEIRGVLACNIACLLNRHYRVVDCGSMPAVAAFFPVAVNSLVGRHAVLLHLVHDELCIFRGYVIAVDKHRELLFF